MLSITSAIVNPLSYGSIKRLLLAESKRRVWTERKRQRNVSISAYTPALGGRAGRGRTCATREDKPRPVWTSLPITQ